MPTFAEMENWGILEPQLRQLWGEGHSTAEIGRRLGKTKNAIVGKSSRLGLPARPSPIKHMAPEDRKYQPKMRSIISGPTIPKLPSEIVNEEILMSDPIIIAAPKITARPARKISPFGNLAPRPKITEPLAPKYGRMIECQWIDGDPRERKFCDQRSEPGRPYCQPHCYLAYVKVGPVSMKGIGA